VKPQTPIKPYPYIEKDVTFVNASDGTILNGTLTLPDLDNQYPAVILVTGSGQHDRDETIGEHKPFMVIADYLTRNGIAVLRYDDRHLNLPIKKAWTFTSFDFAGDAKSAVDFLSTHENIDQKSIGIMGHSEGGYIAPIVASKDNRVSFIISLAGPGVSGEKIVGNQAKDFSTNDNERCYNDKARNIVRAESDIKVRKKKVKALHKKIFGRFNLKAKLKWYPFLDMIVSNWYKSFIESFPVEYWKKE